MPAYARFLARFPTPAVCAAAPLGEVLRAWKGLGYNRRARNLHAAATAMVADHGGRVPSELHALLALPGVGPYTARAVLAFAFDADVGVVDTNAGRVLSRAVAGRSLGLGEAQQLVDAMVPAGRGWAFGQALLDLGATVCVSGTPTCSQCPVRRRCRWAMAGRDPSRPGPWVGGGIGGPDHLRGIRPSGPGPAGGRATGRRGHRRRPARGRRVAGRPGPGGSDRRRPGGRRSGRPWPERVAAPPVTVFRPGSGTGPRGR